MSDWGGGDTTLWPCIRLVGEKASLARKEPQGPGERRAMMYLHYPLLARPDLHVTQGLSTSESDVMFLLGIGGIDIHTLSVGWDSVRWACWLRSHSSLQRPHPHRLSRPERPKLHFPSDASTSSRIAGLGLSRPSLFWYYSLFPSRRLSLYHS
jgi:hypothetical protein